VRTLLALAILGAGVGGDPLEDGLSRFDGGDFEGALRVAQAAVAHDPDPAHRAQLRLLEARCALALRRELDVEAALSSALLDDPTLAVDPNVVGPGFAATVERLRLTLAGSVSIEAVPPGMAIRVDGAIVGKAPMTERLAVGRHHLAALDGTGQEAAAAEVVVAPRQTQSIRLAIAAPPPTAEPPGRPTPLAPAAALHVTVDPLSGAALQAGLALVAEHWLVEADGVAGGASGATVRAGLRTDLLSWLGVQATADGALFFTSPVLPGAGLSAGVSFRPVAFLDLVAQGSGMLFSGHASFRSQYFLADLGVRVRWPFGSGQ
jgi:hypothetical protein